MEPINPPEWVKPLYPNDHVIRMNPPPGVPEEECGIQEVLGGRLFGGVFDGGPVLRTFWSLTEEEIDRLRDGAVIQFYMFANELPPNGANVISNVFLPDDEE